MKVFLSYARLDREAVESLLVRLREFEHEVWFDERLVAGEDWWAEILEQIRSCDVFVVARSAHYARSRICRAEREYAESLGRFLLPVRVGASAEDIDGLGGINTVDWRSAGERRIAKLALALPQSQALRPLPDPLPDLPALPVVSLERSYEIVNGLEISSSDEDALLRKLGPLVDDPDMSESVIALLRDFVARPKDVTAAGLEEAKALLTKARRTVRARRGASSLQDLRLVLGPAGRGGLLPIVGFGLTEGLLGPRSRVAQRLSLDHQVARTGQLSEGLPGVAQFLAGFYSEHDMRALVVDAFRQSAVEAIGDDQVDPEAGVDQLVRDLWNRERHPEEPYTVIAELRCPIFVNAHPSGLLVDALRAAGKEPRVEHCRWRTDTDEWPPSPFRPQPGETPYRPSVDEPLVFQVFGSFEYPETLILSEDDYLQFLHHLGRREGATADDAVPMCVKAAAATSRLLMVGFGLEELDARVLMMALIEQEGGAKRKSASLAVQIDPDGPAGTVEQAREYLKRYFLDEHRIRMYWGSAEAFVGDLATLRNETV